MKSGLLSFFLSFFFLLLSFLRFPHTSQPLQSSTPCPPTFMPSVSFVCVHLAATCQHKSAHKPPLSLIYSIKSVRVYQTSHCTQSRCDCGISASAFLCLFSRVAPFLSQRICWWARQACTLNSSECLHVSSFQSITLNMCKCLARCWPAAAVQGGQVYASSTLNSERSTLRSDLQSCWLVWQKIGRALRKTSLIKKVICFHFGSYDLDFFFGLNRINPVNKTFNSTFHARQVWFFKNITGKSRYSPS